MKCYSSKLASEDALVREKAVFEIGMMRPSEEVSSALVMALQSDSPETREVATFFLYRHPTEDALPVVRRLIEAEDGRGAESRIERGRLEALEVFIKCQSR